MLEYFDLVNIGVGILVGLLGVVTGTLVLKNKMKKFLERRQENRRRILKMPLTLAKIEKMGEETRAAVSEIQKKQLMFEKELAPNGGTSLKDQVSMLVREKMVEYQEAPYPLVRVTSGGHHVFCNYAYGALIEDHSGASEGLGWMQFMVSMDDADELLRKFIEVTKAGTRFTDHIKFQTGDHVYRGEWRSKAVPLGPYIYHGKETNLWIAKLYPVDEEAKQIAEEHNWHVE